MKQKPNIAVLGGGIVGFTVAQIAQEKLPEAQITVIADSFEQDTVSSVAAGIFRPGLSFKGPTKEITKKWIRDSWDYWQRILHTPDASEAGVMTFGAYIFAKENYNITRNHLIEDIVPQYREVDDNELKLCGGDWKHGAYFSTLKIGCERHLPWVKKIFLEKGGKIIKGKVENFPSLSKYDLVFNCSGFGAKFLCKDDDLVPIRGQVIKVKAPWLKTAFYGDYDTYIIPGFDGIATCGGVRQYDSYNLSPCKHDTAAIMERCEEMLPALRAAEVVEVRVGLRPHRSPVRVEVEVKGTLPVVHCYGHGGYGVMCAPGTAIHAVDIALDALKVKSKL